MAEHDTSLAASIVELCERMDGVISGANSPVAREAALVARKEAIAALLVASPHSPDRRATELTQAAFKGNLPTVVALLAAAGGSRLGSLSSLQDGSGNSPLHTAALGNGDLSLLRLLLQAGFSARAQNHAGATPLHLLCSRPSGEQTEALVALLLGSPSSGGGGADASLVDSAGDSPLHYAALWDNTTAIRLLLLQPGPKAAVNAANAAGLTALHAASMRGHTTTASLLLQAGASVDARTLSGKTPAELASTLSLRKLLSSAAAFSVTVPESYAPPRRQSGSPAAGNGSSASGDTSAPAAGSSSSSSSSLAPPAPGTAAAAPARPRPQLMHHQSAPAMTEKQRAQSDAAQPPKPRSYVTSEEELAHYREVFKMFDGDGDGRISCSEFATTAMAALGIALSTAQVDRLMRIASRSNDHLLCFDDFVLALHNNSAAKPENLTEQSLAAAFKQYDADGDGYITSREIRLTMRSVGVELSDSDLTAMIAAADTDGDGAVSEEEFLRLMLAR